MINGERWTMSARDSQRLQVIGDYREGRLSRKDAALLCDLSQRSVARLTRKIRQMGPQAVEHGNKGRSPPNKIPADVEIRAMALMKSRYFDFNLLHAWEMLRDNHGFSMSPDTLRRWCRQHGVGKRKKRRPSKARIARERMASLGLMIQMDGSTHNWVKHEKWCLIGGIDDATSLAVGCEFFRSETTFATLAVLRSIVERYGLPASVYVDRGKAFGGTKNEEDTQFSRACEELGITVINALSPQAKGRIERMWRTLQDRLTSELRLNGIHSIGAANTYLRDQFLPHYWNKRNTVPARDPESRFRQVDTRLNLDLIFCKKYPRRIRTGQLFEFRGRTYLLKSPVKGSIAGHTAMIHETADGYWRVFYRGLEAKFVAWDVDGRARHYKRAS